MNFGFILHFPIFCQMAWNRKFKRIGIAPNQQTSNSFRITSQVPLPVPSIKSHLFPFQVLWIDNPLLKIESQCVVLKRGIYFVGWVCCKFLHIFVVRHPASCMDKKIHVYVVCHELDHGFSKWWLNTKHSKNSDEMTFYQGVD